MALAAVIAAVAILLTGFMDNDSAQDGPAGAMSRENTRRPKAPRPAGDPATASAEPVPSVDDRPENQTLTEALAGQDRPDDLLPPGFVEVQGTIRVRDGGDGWIGGLSGRLTLGVQRRDDAGKTRQEWRKVDVREGSWKARLPREAKVAGTSAVLERRVIRIQVMGHAVQQDSPSELIGQFEDARLRVVDSVSGSDLEQVTILESPNSTSRGHDCFLLPRKDVRHEILREGKRSPLHLKARALGHLQWALVSRACQGLRLALLPAVVSAPIRTGR